MILCLMYNVMYSIEKMDKEAMPVSESHYKGQALFFWGFSYSSSSLADLYSHH